MNVARDARSSRRASYGAFDRKEVITMFTVMIDGEWVVIDTMPDRETREFIRRERHRIAMETVGDARRAGPHQIDDPEKEGRAAFAAIGQPWPGDQQTQIAA